MVVAGPLGGSLMPGAIGIACRLPTVIATASATDEALPQLLGASRFSDYRKGQFREDFCERS